MRIWVVDPGYSSIKVAMMEGNRLRMLHREPTIVAEIPEWTPQWEFDGTEGKDLIWEGKRYAVGSPGITGLQIPVDREVLYGLALPLYLSKFGVVPEDEVVILVSLSDWDLCPTIKETLDRFGLKRIRVVPQGIGIWIRAGSPKDALVIDIGFETVDVIPFVNGKAENSLAFAVHKAGLVSFLSGTSKDDPRLLAQRLEKGDPGLRGLVRKHYWRWLSVRLAARPEWNAVPMGKLIFGGGGAWYLPSDLGVIVKNPELANVEGIAKALLARKRKEVKHGEEGSQVVS